MTCKGPVEEGLMGNVASKTVQLHDFVQMKSPLFRESKLSHKVAVT